MLWSESAGMEWGSAFMRSLSAFSSRISSTTRVRSARMCRDPLIMNKPPMTMPTGTTAKRAVRGEVASEIRPIKIAPPRPPIPKTSDMPMAEPSARMR